MPALKVVTWGRLAITSRPFASDDLQILICLFFLYRVVQLACILPFCVKLFLFRLSGWDFIGPSGEPSWCIDSLDALPLQFQTLNTSDPINEVHGEVDHGKAMFIPFSLYLVASLLYTFLDMTLSLAMWSAASLGTPTDPRGRESILRYLLYAKIIFMNMLLLLLLGSGIFLVHDGRKYNYGCGSDRESVIETFEGSAWYVMFSLTMVTYAFELLLWPCIVTNQVAQSIVSQTRGQSLFNYVFFFTRKPSEGREHDSKHRTIVAMIGDCITCLQCLSCNKLGGGKIRSKVDLNDAAVAFMDFFNIDSVSQIFLSQRLALLWYRSLMMTPSTLQNFDLVLSDVYITFKLLARMHRERKFKLGQQARTDERCKRRGHEDAQKEGTSDNSTMNKKVLQYTQETDMDHLRDAARYSHYALGVYDNYHDSLIANGQLIGGMGGIYYPWKMCMENHARYILQSCFRLSSYTVLVYGNFANDVLCTAYCILVDEQVKKIVVAIRGTSSLEDLVTDLQFSSVSMERVGRECGFDGSEKYVHRGILNSSKWIYNDIAKQKVLARLLPPQQGDEHNEDSGSLHGFSLVFTGHSLGAGIAAILGTMYRSVYPDLKVYAFCPPGCTAGKDVARECEEFVTSIVVGSDIIPRIKLSNFERLRYEFLETLARVKVSKIDAWKDIRKSCRNKDLEQRNRRLLCPKDEIPTNTHYFKELESVRDTRERMLEEQFPVETRLDIPGRIIHLVRAVGRKEAKRIKYLPYWASADSFRELDLNTTAIGEHNMDRLVEYLDNIADLYSSGFAGIDVADDDDDSIPSSTNLNHRSSDDTAADDRWFIFCGRPHGSVTLIPTFLAVAAACCSIIGNNICSLFLRDVDGDFYFNATDSSVEKIEAVSLGLYTYGFEYYDEESERTVVECASHPPHIEADVYLKLSRSFAVIALLIGFPTLAALFVSNCMKLTDRTFRIIACCLFIVTCCESFLFLFMKSIRCHYSPDELSPGVLVKGCQLNTGAKMAIVATILWFLSAVFTGYIHQAINVEWRLLAFTMSFKRMYQ